MEANHPYAQVNLKKNPTQLCFDLNEIQWGHINNYVIHKKIGRGRYSQVFQGTDKKSGKRVAIKVLGPIRKQKIRRQYHILKSLNHHNIIKLRDIVKSDQLKCTSFVFQLAEQNSLRDLCQQLNLEQIKIYMKQLFNALDFMHLNGVIHRDIKPLNLLINHQKKQLKVIDFGLSDYYYPGKENNENVGSLYYRAPELIFGNLNYDYRVDCWAAGLILAGLVFKKIPFLYGNNEIDQILKIMKIVGTKETIEYIKAYKLVERKGHSKENFCFDLLMAFQKGEVSIDKKTNFQEFVRTSNKQNCTWQALDLIKKLLVLDYNKRFTAKQALNHPFFD